MRTCPNWYWKLGLALTNKKSKSLPAPPPVQPGPPLILMMVLPQEVWGVPAIRPHLTQTHQGGFGQLWYGHSFRGLCHLLEHRWSDHTNCPEEVPEEGMSFLQAQQKQPLDWGSTERDEWQLPGCVQIWPWEHSNAVGSHSCGILQLLWNAQDDGQDWPTAPHRSSHQLPNLHQRLRGQSLWWAKTLVLLLKQYLTHYYHFYEKGMTRAMVGLQGLHLSNTFRCFNISSSVGLKSFCFWCFKLGGNTEMIATQLS